MATEGSDDNNNESQKWLEHDIKPQVQRKTEEKEWRELNWTEFVKEVAWWLHTEKRRNDLDTIDAVAGLTKCGIMRKNDLIDVAGSSPNRKDFREALVETGVPCIFCDFLFNRCVAPQQQQQQQQLSDLTPDKEDDTRRKSLDAETEKDMPTVKPDNREELGTHLKFVNREKNVNELLKHAAKQCFMFLSGIKEKQLQHAACSGGPGLGKTTFCRKAFTRAADVSGGTEDTIWEDVDRKETFYEVVKTCVNKGRQHRISYGGASPLSDLDVKHPETSFAHRIVMQCVAKNKNVEFPMVEGRDQLQSVICRITREDRDALVVINIDETNKLMEHASGSDCLRKVLIAVLEINKKRKGFVFCMLSGTNVGPLHDLLFSSSGKAPKEIPLPLLEVQHMNDVLFDLAHRGEASDLVSNELQFVLKVLSGVPRCIEMLVCFLGEDAVARQFTIGTCRGALNSTDVEPHHLLERVKAAMNAHCGHVFSKMVAELPCNVLVAHSLFRWPVARNEKVGSHEVGELEKRGIVFLHQRQEQERNVIVFPLILLLNLAHAAARENAPMLLQKFDVRLSSDENERNTLAMLALKCSALSSMKVPAKLSTVFPLNGDVFPKLSDRIREIVMSFDRFEVQEAETQVTKTSWAQWLQKLGNAGGFLVNCKGAPFADMIIVSKGGEFVMLLQEKQGEVAKRKAEKRQRVPTASLEMVKNEHQKCDVATPHLFVLITDEDFAEQSSLEDNEIVLSFREHSIAIGPLLALLRKHNHGYRQKININE